MSKKRANNEGTIRQHASGLWEARFTAGYDVAGKQIRKSLYANTKAEVSKRLREALRSLERGELVEPSDMTVAEWLETWFKVYGRPRWRDSTAAEHYRNIQQNLKPKLGRHKLQRLRHEHIQDYVNQQAAKGRASASIKKQLEPLRASLKQAVINNLIIKDPSLHLALPSTPAREIQFLTIDEQRKLLGVLPEQLQGELCILSWAQV